MSLLKDQCAVIGIGETPFSKDSGMSEIRADMQVEATCVDVEDTTLPYLRPV